jgi:hypothetical protein
MPTGKGMAWIVAARARYGDLLAGALLPRTPTMEPHPRVTTRPPARHCFALVPSVRTGSRVGRQAMPSILVAGEEEDGGSPFGAASGHEAATTLEVVAPAGHRVGL